MRGAAIVMVYFPHSRFLATFDMLLKRNRRLNSAIHNDISFNAFIQTKPAFWQMKP
jgi:hypothetical protein